MLEIKNYTIKELSIILGTDTKQGIDRKLERYGVVFVSRGSGENRIYEIQEITAKFKVFCITEMGMSANVNFEKFKYFCYYLFCDEEFADFPVIEMEVIMSSDGIHVSRQTISNWLRCLSRIGYIHYDRQTDCIYYAITKTPDKKKHYAEISREKYSKGWQLYWNNKAEIGTDAAYGKMYKYIGGHPHKHPKICLNGFFTKEIEMLIELVNDAFLE